MKKIKLNRHDKYRHGFFWGILLIHTTFFDQHFDAALYVNVIYVALYYIGCMTFYYVLSLYIFPIFWKNKKVLFVIYFTGLYIIFGMFFYVLNYILIPYLNPSISHNSSIFKYIISRWFLYSIITYSAYAFYKTKIRLYYLQEDIEKEQSLLVNELSFFQNQFNAHITFNFLNYCYAHTYKHSEKAANGIELYSNLLRYSIGSNADKAVSIGQETDYLNSFIELKRLLSKDLFVNFTCNAQNPEVLIYPRILITYVENAFKHGVSTDRDKPITINLNTKDNELVFKVKNTIKPVEQYKSTGTGLQNARQTLDLYYPGKHKLSVNETEDEYTVELLLNLT